jgi:hypothetical protein
VVRLLAPRRDNENHLVAGLLEGHEEWRNGRVRPVVDLAGALVSIDAMVQSRHSQGRLPFGRQGQQAALHADIEIYFETDRRRDAHGVLAISQEFAQKSMTQ